MRRPSPSAVVAVLALVVALSSSAYAAIVVTGRNVKDGSLTSADVQDGSLRSRDVRNGVLSGADVEPDSLGGAQIEERSLGTVPRARNADRASTANSAGSADSAQALADGAGNRAFFGPVTSTDLELSQSKSLTSTEVPPGRYVVMARAQLVRSAPTYGFANCGISAGTKELTKGSEVVAPQTEDAAKATPSFTRTTYSDLVTTTIADRTTLKVVCAAGVSGLTVQGASLVAIQVGELR